ncbi:MAG: type II secretion system protein [Planctomycetota bacterium]|nr:type II secretion system protein [Planctomycetota bacterium]
MKRTKGFTLVELLVVVAIIALLVSILLPTLGRAKEMARQALCAANLNGVGKGLVLYASANDDSAPWIRSITWSSVKTGTNAKSLTTPALVSPTALMFLVVRSGQPADIFRCPSDGNASKMQTVRFTESNETYYYWDFYDAEVDDPSNGAANSTKISYSFQAPISSGGMDYKAGYTTSSKGGLAIMADKTPEFDKTDDDDDSPTALIDWSSSLSDKNRKRGMSQNHLSGDAINVLYADYHVSASESRADVGIDDDNIYSASGESDEGTQGEGSIDLADHLSTVDSFLIGPIKETN